MLDAQTARACPKAVYCQIYTEQVYLAPTQHSPVVRLLGREWRLLSYSPPGLCTNEI